MAVPAEQQLAMVLLHLGHAEAATAHGRHAVQVAERIGARLLVAESQTLLGEIARHDGQLDAAETAYRGALQQLRALGHRNALICEINLGLVDVQRGEHARARGVLQASLAQLEERRRPDLAAAVHVFLLPCCAAVADWEAFDSHFEQARYLVSSTGMVDGDIADAAERAATMVDGVRGQAVRAFAAAQRAGLAGRA
jgi:tetratricopeptide (TPR) repeat protein